MRMGVKITSDVKKIYQVKYVISGDIIEQYSYEKNQYVGFETNNKDGKNKGSLRSEENRGQTLSRARKEVMRTINSNPDLNKFLTLTFEENVKDLDFANNELKKWIKRVNYHCFKTKKSKMKYVAVIEFQERGAVHYHLLCNLPYVDLNDFSKIWGHGYIKLNKIKGNKAKYGSDECDNVGAYVTKYMTKDNADERLVGRKSYLMSRNLNKPETLYVDINEKDLLAQVYGISDCVTAVLNKSSILSGCYENDFTGTVVYHQYNLKRMRNQR